MKDLKPGVSSSRAPFPAPPPRSHGPLNVVTWVMTDRRLYKRLARTGGRHDILLVARDQVRHQESSFKRLKFPGCKTVPEQPSFLSPIIIHTTKLQPLIPTVKSIQHEDLPRTDMRPARWFALCRIQTRRDDGRRLHRHLPCLGSPRNR
jgi:hypothetical protein